MEKFPKKIESEKPEEEEKKLEENQESKEKPDEIVEASFEKQIDECNNRIEAIANKIDLLVDQYRFKGNEWLDLGYEPSKERLNDITGCSLEDEELIERMNVFSLHLAAKKAQLEILERKLDKEEKAEK